MSLIDIVCKWVVVIAWWGADRHGAYVLVKPVPNVHNGSRNANRTHKSHVTWPCSSSSKIKVNPKILHQIKPDTLSYLNQIYFTKNWAWFSTIAICHNLNIEPVRLRSSYATCLTTKIPLIEIQYHLLQNQLVLESKLQFICIAYPYHVLRSTN